MKKNIWILNHYAGNMYFDKGGRHYWFAKNLNEMGYEAVIFVANSKHGTNEKWIESDKGWIEQKAEEINTPFVFVKVTTYADGEKGRLRNMTDYFINVKKAAKEYAEIHGKPDVILASSVHPLTLVAGIQLAKYFHVKCYSEIRDLWPEEIIAYSDRWTENSILMKILFQGEKWIYKKSDGVIFLQEGAYDYIKKQGWEKAIPESKTYYINNGVDVGMFDKNAKECSFDDKDLYNKDFTKVVYTGSVRHVNNLGKIVDVAKNMMDTNVRFLIWGAGDQVDILSKRCKDEGIKNIAFKGKVDKKYVPGIISKSDINMIHWEMSGDLDYGPSFNKMFEYLAAGRPIFSTLQTPYSIIGKNKCGVSSEDNTVGGIEKALRNMISLSNEVLDNMGEQARATAYQFDFSELTKKLIEIIEQ